MNFKPYIATPCYARNLDMGYVVSLTKLFRLFAEKDISYKIQFATDSLVTRVRNWMTSEFLKTDCTHLLFIDADITFNPIDVLRLYETDKAIIGGAYPIKSIKWDRIKSAISAGDNPETAYTRYCVTFYKDVINQTIDVTQPYPVLELGTGFLLIKREVFEDMSKNNLVEMSFCPMHKDYVTKYWTTGADDQGIELSEDYYFQHLARKMGVETYVLPSINLSHTGFHEFKGDFPQSLKYGVGVK